MVSGCCQWSGTLWSGYCPLLTLSPICFCTACVWGYGHPWDCFWELMKLLFSLASGCVRVCVCMCVRGMVHSPPRGHRAVLTAGKPACTLLHWLRAGPLAWCSRPSPPTLSGQRCPALDRWWPGGHADTCGLGLRAASGEGGQQGSLDASSGCLLGPRSHSGLSSTGSGLGLPGDQSPGGLQKLMCLSLAVGPWGGPRLASPASASRDGGGLGRWAGAQHRGHLGPRAGVGSAPAGLGAGRGAGGRAAVFSMLGPGPAFRFRGLQGWGSQSPEASAVQDAQLPETSRVQPSVCGDVAWRPE